jgi:eukaryotic-like serine/threonine-protein kinase
VPAHSKVPTSEATFCRICGAHIVGVNSTCAQCGATLSIHDAETVDSSGGSVTAGTATPFPSSTSPSSAVTVESAVPAQSHEPPTGAGTFPDFGSRYRVEHMLGEGGMGTIYKAWDKELERTVALKLIRRDLVRDPDVTRRFKQELLLASKISHRNILRIHDLGDGPGDTKFISMAFVDGQDLSQLLKKDGKLPLQRALNIARQLCAALDAAHAEGVVHRDLKPQNILVDQHDHVYVSDFGLAKSLESDLGMTLTGQFLGTPRYMSPEQAEIRPVDHRTDLYAFGLILCEMVTGNLPFERTQSTMQMMYQRVHETPKDPRRLNPDLPEYLARIIQKCLERDVDLRYQSATELLADLDAGVSGSKSSSIRGAWARAKRALARGRLPWRATAITAMVVAVAAVGGIFFLRPRPASTAAHAPISVLVADFTNHTGDPVFDGTLEPMFNVALEGASFVNGFSRGEARKLARKLPKPTDKLDEESARLVAVSQGLGAVVIGAVSRRGGSYKVSVEALDARSGNSIATADVLAPNKDEVLRAIPKLAAPIRKALGDNTPESVQLSAVRGTFTVASVEAVHLESLALDQQFAGKFEEALQTFSKVTELDPNFAAAYAGMAAMAENLGRQKDAERYMNLAMQHEDRMTERERYRQRGMFYATKGNWQKCVDEYSQLLDRYPADRLGPVNLSTCFGQLRNIPKAIAASRKAVELVPRGVLQRINLSFFSSFGGDFRTGEQEARVALQLNPSSEIGYYSLGEAQLGQGQLAQAAESYRQLEKVSDLGASMAAISLADLALYEGRFGDAVRILEEGAAADLAAKDPDAAANKFAALAYTQWCRQEKQPAISAAEKALANSQAVSIRFLAARIFVETGEIRKAQKLADGLGSELQAEPQAYAKVIRGKIASRQGDAREAIKNLTEANALLDTWIGRLELGRVYLQAGAFVEADSEFDRCINRRGEAIELFLDDVPTYGYFPPVYYYQGRVREGLKSPEFVSSYRTYLEIRSQAGEDPLLAEVRRRAGQ